MLTDGAYHPERPPQAIGGVVIRRLEPAEHKQFRALRLECLQLQPVFSGTTYAEAIAAPALPFERFIATGSTEHFMLGAFVGRELLGTCGFERELRVRARHRGKLAHVYVSPRLTRRGVGGRLVCGAIEHAFMDPTVLQIVLSVVADNDRAVRLYERAGFREYGRLHNYFRTSTTFSTQLFMVRDRPDRSAGSDPSNGID